VILFSSRSPFKRREHRILLLLLLLLTACSTGVPTELPTIVVNITAVQNQQAVDNAVNATLTAMAANSHSATMTAMARAGTPATNTPLPTDRPSATPVPAQRLTPTPSLTPSITPTPTFLPFFTSTPAPSNSLGAGMIRVINVFRDLTLNASLTTNVDLYINDQRVFRALEFGQATNYFQVAPGGVRLSLYPVDAGQMNPASKGDPLTSLLVPVEPGGILSVFISKGEHGLTFNIFRENTSLVTPQRARLALLNFNPQLMPVNLMLPDIQRALVYNFRTGQMVGPFELPTGEYTPELYSASDPNLFIEAFSDSLRLDNQASYIVVLLPPLTPDTQTDYLVFPGKTVRPETDFAARFINLAPDTGRVNVQASNQVLISNFEPNVISPLFSLPVAGSSLIVSNDDFGELVNMSLGGNWKNEVEADADKIILFYETGKTGQRPSIGVKVISQDAPPSALNANIRLIHALPGVVQLNLQTRLSVRPVLPTVTYGPNTPVPTAATGDLPWQPGPIANFSEASFYTQRPAQTYDIRVVLAGTETVYAEADNVQLLANGIYDVLVLPGSTLGSARITILQPDVQPARVEATLVNATAVNEAVQSTLTALAPKVTATPTRVITPTATPTPPPTNTPRPSNTPEFPAPSISVNPAPPNTAWSDVKLTGLYFSPGLNYRVSLDNNPNVATGRTDASGALTATITLSPDIPPGPHVITVCADCRPGGANQAAYTTLLVAAPNLTPSPSPSR
jgi:hypothetical protein